jgi:hypothetical protein
VEIELHPSAPAELVEAVYRALYETTEGATPGVAAYVSPWRLAALAEAVERGREPVEPLPGADGAGYALSPRSSRGATRA